MSGTLAGKLAKAVYAALSALLGSLATILVGNASFGDVTDGQWVTIAAFTLAAFGGAFGLAGWAGPRGNSDGK